MKIYKFDCNGHNSPAYGCDKPSDNSGEYYRAEDVAGLNHQILQLKISRNAALSREKEANQLWSKAAMKWAKEKENLINQQGQ